MSATTGTTAKLGKRYTNWVGNVFQRVELSFPNGIVREVDIKVREGRDGLVMFTGAEAKAEALRRVGS